MNEPLVLLSPISYKRLQFIYYDLSSGRFQIIRTTALPLDRKFFQSTLRTAGIVERHKERNFFLVRRHTAYLVKITASMLLLMSPLDRRLIKRRCNVRTVETLHREKGCSSLLRMLWASLTEQILSCTSLNWLLPRSPPVLLSCNGWKQQAVVLQAALSYWSCRVAAVIGSIQLVSITISGVEFTTVDLSMTCVWSAAHLLRCRFWCWRLHAVVTAGSAPKYRRLIHPLANIYCAWHHVTFHLAIPALQKQAGGLTQVG